MTDAALSEPQWIEDGHRIIFRIERDIITIFYVECPFEGQVALCNRGREDCIINTFTNVYGAEINIGSCNIDGPMEIAWVPQLGECDLDREFAQVWIIPLADPDYKAYKVLKEPE